MPLAELQRMAGGLLGGGASSDADGAADLLGDKLGLWMRGNYSVGEQDAPMASPSFDAKQWATMGGIDYRLTAKTVIGIALAYGDSSVEFTPSGAGGLDTTSWAASLYGSAYAAGNFYLDAVLNAARSDYAATCNIEYQRLQGYDLIDFQDMSVGLRFQQSF